MVAFTARAPVGGAVSSRGRKGSRAAGRVAVDARPAPSHYQTGQSGIEGGGPRPVVGFDWMTLSGPDGRLDAASEVLQRYFGPVIREQGGQFMCKASRCFEGGAKLHFGHAARVCVVDVRGEALAGLSGDDRVSLLRELLGLGGFKATRVDIAVDFVGQRLGLIQKVREAMVAGDVVRPPKHAQPHLQCVPGGELLTGMTLGKRGSDGSGRQLVVYDKGVESEEFEPGVHERWEARFSQERADDVARAVCAAADWERCALGYALWIYQFCEAAECDDRHADRRAPLDWWAELVGLVDKCVTRAKRRLTSLAARITWLRKAVIPGLAAMARDSLQSLGELTETMFADVEAAAAGLVQRQFRQWRERGADWQELAVFA